ncbi:hypothetical protein [Agrococcus sp. ProA11]
MDMFDLLGTIANVALAALALATATIVVVGSAVIAGAWALGALAGRDRHA